MVNKTVTRINLINLLNEIEDEIRELKEKKRLLENAIKCIEED